jgi:ABC-2 type transport system permease protein
MTSVVKASGGITRESLAALRVEFQKVRHSKTLWITALAFAFITIICGLFMFILKDPERARSLGLLGAKAQFFGGSADWPGFITLVLVIMSVGGLIIFGFIFVWIFGREFGDKTVYDLLSLPTSRITIVSAKTIIAACWSVALILLVFILMLVIGAILQLPDWSAAVVLDGLGDMLVTGLLAMVLCIPFALVASVTRGYLPAVGCIFLVLILSQVFSALGHSQYFPWSVPGLYSGAAEALTGETPTPLGPVSYILVGAVVIISLVTMDIWWKYADQT